MLTGPRRGIGLIRTRGEVRTSSGTYRLVLESDFQGEHDVRSFESHTCQALADAAAVFLAIALEPGLYAELAEPPVDVDEPALVPEPRATEHPPSPAPVLAQPPETLHPGAERPPPANAEVEPSERTAPASRVGMGVLPFAALRLGVGVDYGVLDFASLNILSGVAVTWPRFELGLDVLYFAPRRLPREGPGGLYQGVGGGVRGCVRIAGTPVEVPVCVGVEAGAARAEGRGLTTVTGVQWGPWVRPNVSVGVTQRRRWGGWWIALQVGIGAYRTGFLIGGASAVDAELLSLRLVGGGTLDFHPRR